jgi:UDP-N-acetylmuramoylalanine--D-glutamate ligase
MKIAILGYGLEGQSSYQYFLGQDGHEITICDVNPNAVVPSGVKAVLGDNYLDKLDSYDVLVRSSGLAPMKILEKNPQVSNKITTQLNEFLKVCPSTHIIGVTGTKGKGTTSTLIAKMLEASGKQVVIGGNIGVPPLTLLDKITMDSFVVLELSSYQLIDLNQPAPHVAVCLMVEEEHLDWHIDMDEYVASKARLFMHQKPEDIAIYFADNKLSKQIAAASSGTLLHYYAPPGGAYIRESSVVIDDTVICQTDELKLLGKHNWQNVCAAITVVWQVSKDVSAFHSVLTSFSGLPHRLELVREVNGVRYYNDSFASNLHAAEAALEAIEGKKVMIVGGYDRNLNLDHFGEFAAGHQAEFRTILIIGESAARVELSLKQAGFGNYILDETLKTMTEVVQRASSLAQSGDAVVLSPGFASFDMFKNFEDRGQQFKAAVNEL